MSDEEDNLPSGGFNVLVPEFDVFDLQESLTFWCDALGFRICYQRPEDEFAYLERDGAQVMLNTHNGHWQTGPLEKPLGRGINFQIAVSRIEPILQSLAGLGHALFREPQETWYRRGDTESGCREFLVLDPNGYLLRFSEDLGQRFVPSSSD